MIIDIDSIYSFCQLGERDNQEDSRWPDSDRPNTGFAAFVVCDGVGGCDKGEVASAAVCATIGNLTHSHRNTDLFTEEDFRQLLSRCYKALDDLSDESNKGMGTTLTFLAFHSLGVLAAHIGDSRIYQFRPGDGILYRSEDHSLVSALLRSGNISPDEVKNHPRGNVITRCMCANDGTRDRDEASVVNLQDIAPDDYFLLCSDGVTGEIDEEELLELYMSDRSDKEKYVYLADRCKNSSDNSTAIQIHIGSVTDASQFDYSCQIAGEQTEIERTQILQNVDNSVHDLSAIPEKVQSKIKSFIYKLFK